MTTTLQNTDWRKVSAGYWTAELEAHRFVARRRAWGSGWEVFDEAGETPATRNVAVVVPTLSEAQDRVRRQYCERGWTVSGPDLHGATLHWCVAITIGRTGPLTHHEALEEARRLNALTRGGIRV